MNLTEPIEGGHEPILDEAENDGSGSRKTRGTAATFTQNSLLNVGRLLISTAVGFVLPAFLIHRLPVTTYSAWVLILQLSAYVNYLDFGIQTGIAKYVAEYQARNDPAGTSVRASAGLALLLITSLAGVVLTLVLAWRVPQLFHEMPPSLYHDVRLGLIFIGCSASLSLFCSIFGSIFTGLQRFGVTTMLALAGRILFVAVVLGAVYFHSSLATMGALVAIVNVATGIMSFIAWRKMASRIRLSLRNVDYEVLRKMVAYCSALAIWTVGMLCVSGLDVTIVGRYDFSQTAFYAIATSPTNFMLAILGAALAPLMPAASGLSVHRSAAEMGAVLARITRYSSTLLVLSGLPLLVAGYWFLRVWVGPSYAVQIVGYMRILVLANIVRNTFAPYANMLVATNSQKVAIAGASAEAIVNVVCSVALARHIGAIGVAYGTLIGSFVSIGMHLAVSMHYTHDRFTISRVRLIGNGIARPAVMAIPSVLLLSYWWVPAAPLISAPVWGVWGASTLLLGWFVSLTGPERERLAGMAVARMKLAAG